MPAFASGARASLWLVVLAKPVLTLLVGSLVPFFLITGYYSFPNIEAQQAARNEALETQEAETAAMLSADVPGDSRPTGGTQSPEAMEQSVTFPIPHALPPVFNATVWTADRPHFVLWLWFAGVVLFGLAAVVDRLRLRRLVKQGNAPPFHVAGRVSRASEQVGIRHAPPLFVTDSLESPALAGWFRPVILLPSWLVEAGREDALDWALRHELTHLKHRDPFANGVRRLAEILFFFHPALWWASRNWELAMELACDRALVETEDDVTRYAEQLSVMLREAHQRRRHALAAGLFATRTQIHARIAALVDNALQVRARLGAVRVSTLVLFACLVFAFGGTAVDRKAIESAVQSDAPVELSPAPEEWGDVPRVDAGLQAYCENLLEGQAGAIVVLNADTGAVLALASAPYAPFVETLRMQQAGNPDSSPRVLPRFHRAYRAEFPPGSLFKVVLAAAALEEGVITPESRFACGGQFQIDGKGRPWRCWKQSGHGSLTVEEALAYSCDAFFYPVALELGAERIQTWAHRMGLGEPTGIALPREAEGLIPDQEWKREVYAERDVWDQRWFPGDTVNLSIGQGSMATTPLQNAVMMATIVNGGYRIAPQVGGGSSPRGERLFSDATLDAVRAGLRMSVEKAPPDYPSGTSWRAGVDGIAVIGKTGSAQVMGLAQHEKYESEEDIPYEQRDHAWFVAGVLDREPRIAVCVLVEHGMHGSTSASILAKPVIEYIYGATEPAAFPPPPRARPQDNRADPVAAPRRLEGPSWTYKKQEGTTALTNSRSRAESEGGILSGVQFEPIIIDPNWRKPPRDVNASPESNPSKKVEAFRSESEAPTLTNRGSKYQRHPEYVKIDENNGSAPRSVFLSPREATSAQVVGPPFLVHFHSGLVQPADSVVDKDPYYVIEYRRRSYRVRKDLVQAIEPREVNATTQESELDKANQFPVPGAGTAETPSG